ncbi:ABC transporter permease [Streptomyces cocklensis]|uniref:FtsX-like permease family protein n=1 Tax=Actinacidiphila cocklensis TaxID=887465 RepID=A0A9W4GUQ1_9ACTN|nr:ABC transporter permease [Actinacidiphila cocklensis]MDD1059540.1 ABC transporter permease [Actinacidiphila cocklensis]WSX76310.1 ABC transporter permease [Streptomyces sp. NBC_00899]CAG6397510.1 FtsX-like permease family protein [Actinacidiphila cocklensis]
MATDLRPGRVRRRAGGPTAPAAVRGGTHHLAVLLAAALAILLSATVLSALAALADRSVQSAVQQRLSDDTDTGVDIFGQYRPQDLADGDKAARAALDRVFGEVPYRTYTALRSPASTSSEYSLIRADGNLSGASSVVVALPDPAAHARLTAGGWPQAAAGRPGARLQMALSQPAAARVGLRVGDSFQLQVGPHRLAVRLTGTYRPAPGDPGVLAGLSSSSGTTDSLAVVAPSAFTAQPALAADALAAWIGAPDSSRLSLGAIGPLHDRAARFAGSDTAVSVFQGKPPAMGGVYTFSRLPDTLAALSAPMAVARAGIDIPAALLAALAAAALVLTARQLAQARAAEIALKGARGAGTGRLVGAAAGQWAVVALPAAVAAPFLAGPLLAGLHRAGLLHGALPASGATAVGWTAALLALAVHGAAVLLPTARTAADRRAGTRLRLRGARAAAFQRAGTDVALTAIAVSGWLELRRYRSPVVGGGVSGTSVDPVLILTPVLMTAAATLLSLRLLPLAAPLIDRAARRAAGFVLPLGGWQIGRRAARHTGPALLMTLALAVGSLGVTSLAILDRGATDQAAFGVGGDLRVAPPLQTLGRVPPTAQRHDVYAALPGATAVTPVTDLGVSRGEQILTVEGVNTAAILATQTSADTGPVPALRSDLTDRPAADLLAGLGAAVPDHGFTLPGRPNELTVTVRLSADGEGPYAPVELTLTTEDADGLPDHLATSLPVTDGTPYTVRLPLGFTGRAPAARRYPLRVIGLGVSIRFPYERRTYHLRIDSAAAPRGALWRDLTDPVYDPAGCDLETVDSETTANPHLCANARTPGALFSGTFRGPAPGSVPPQWDMALGPVAAPHQPPVPALADAALQATGEFDTGAVVALDAGDGDSVKVKIIGRITAVPGVDRSQGRLLVDSRALAAAVVASGNEPPLDDFWLLSARHGDATAAAAALRADPAAGTGTTVRQAARQIRDDPLQRGTRAALVLALVLAPAFAVIGFTLHTAMSARSRRGEFALLRAIGVRRRQLAALLWTEQLGLALLAVVVGSALGALLAAAITPLVSVDATGAPIVPSLAVSVPWLKVTAVALGTALLIVAVVTALARVFARVDLVRVLRAGDEG